jgi:flagellar biosynthesis component FlhA
MSLAQTIGRAARTSMTNNQDIALAAFVLGTLMVLLIPIPTWAMDIMLTMNISVSVIVLLAAIYLQRPTEFAVFPSLLLLLTLFRLSLNVASTRLILADADAGTVIFAFGNFVTSGNMFVGIVIFIILVIIQFVVITKGATRISEVAARFTLDAMPGKQMGVDSDLNAGLITETQARTRRRAIEREADFYGAMDGATKFVRGDAIAGIIIVIVNISVGFVIGIVVMELDFAESARLFTMLTIGDGLVSQIPSLMISTAAGLVVTRSVSDDNLGTDLATQFSRYPRALGAPPSCSSSSASSPACPPSPSSSSAPASPSSPTPPRRPRIVAKTRNNAPRPRPPPPPPRKLPPRARRISSPSTPSRSSSAMDSSSWPMPSRAATSSPASRSSASRPPPRWASSFPSSALSTTCASSPTNTA